MKKPYACASRICFAVMIPDSRPVVVHFSFSGPSINSLSSITSKMAET
jgi:hypothetical protein